MLLAAGTVGGAPRSGYGSANCIAWVTVVSANEIENLSPPLFHSSESSRTAALFPDSREAKFSPVVVSQVAGRFTVHVDLDYGKPVILRTEFTRKAVKCA